MVFIHVFGIPLSWWNLGVNSVQVGYLEQLEKGPRRFHAIPSQLLASPVEHLKPW